jgi:hypothetical protein
MQNVNIPEKASGPRGFTGKNQNDNEKLRGNLVALRNSKCKIIRNQKILNFTLSFYALIFKF